MNKRIRQLAEQAGYTKDMFGIGHWDMPECEKFAELIVQECAEVCYHHSKAAGGVDTAFGYGYKDCGNDIKRHFGVEQ